MGPVFPLQSASETRRPSAARVTRMSVGIPHGRHGRFLAARRTSGTRNPHSSIICEILKIWIAREGRNLHLSAWVRVCRLSPSPQSTLRYHGGAPFGWSILAIRRMMALDRTLFASFSSIHWSSLSSGISGFGRSVNPCHFPAWNPSYVPWGLRVVRAASSSWSTIASAVVVFSSPSDPGGSSLFMHSSPAK